MDSPLDSGTSRRDREKGSKECASSVGRKDTKASIAEEVEARA